MMKGVMGQQNSCKTLIGVHEMHYLLMIQDNYLTVIHTFSVKHMH